MIPEYKQITINGVSIKNYLELQLIQKINDHHYFQLVLDLENIESERTHTIDRSKDWLGKTIEIKTHGKDFYGIVTNVRMNHNNGHHSQIIVSGYSSTIVLENGEHMQSWLKKSLHDIVEEVTKHPKVTADIKPEYTLEISYETQYLESNFQFLKRLAKQYHEWFYYDGETLIFGKPKKEKPLILTYGVDISEMDIGIQTQARKYKAFSYNSIVDERYVSDSPDNPTGLNELGQLAFSASLENYSKHINAYSRQRVGNKAELDEYLKKKQQSDYASSNIISLKTNKRGLAIGDIIDLRSEIFKNKGLFLNKRHGKYIITEIEHYASLGNEYSNKIVALPADIDTLPEPDVDFPIAETQIAIVVDNEDPKKKGRVQVKMAWQTEEMKTPWLRVMTPDGGSSDKASSNRGFVFIPEKGDQVLIGFRYNDPNRPFVMGSLFNGRTGAGGGAGNKSKSITTRSGSTLILDDSKGSVLLSDKGTASLNFNGAGNSLAKADNNQRIVAGKEDEKEKNFLNINASGDITLEGTNSLTITIGSSKLTMCKDGTINICGKDITIGNEKTKQITISSEDSVCISGSGSKANFDENVKISGTQVDIN